MVAANAPLRQMKVSPATLKIAQLIALAPGQIGTHAVQNAMVEHSSVCSLFQFMQAMAAQPVPLILRKPVHATCKGAQLIAPAHGERGVIAVNTVEAGHSIERSQSQLRLAMAGQRAPRLSRKRATRLDVLWTALGVGARGALAVPNVAVGTDRASTPL